MDWISLLPHHIQEMSSLEKIVKKLIRADLNVTLDY